MYIVIMIMGLNKKEVITAGFNLFNAFADLIGNPISGEYPVYVIEFYYVNP